MQAQQQELQHRDDVRAALMRDLEAARFAADRAFRQYDATDPQNRLVAAELELRWNRTLERVTNLQERIDAHDRQQPAPTLATREEFGSLASDLKAIWADPATDGRLKKRIVRTLIHYSFIVVAPEEVALPPEYMVYLDRGRNVFNATMNDVEEFKKLLDAQGVKIVQCNRLDEYEPVEPIERDPFDDEPQHPTFSLPR